jgi:hypothetical protein
MPIATDTLIITKLKGKMDDSELSWFNQLTGRTRVVTNPYHGGQLFVEFKDVDSAAATWQSYEATAQVSRVFGALPRREVAGSSTVGKLACEFGMQGGSGLWQLQFGCAVPACAVWQRCKQCF